MAIASPHWLCPILASPPPRGRGRSGRAQERRELMQAGAATAGGALLGRMAMTTTPRRAPDRRIWTPLGVMRDEAVRELATRFRAGEHFNEIADAMGMGRRSARKKCREVAKALGLRSPHAADRHAEHVEEVRRRAEAGQTNAEIGAALGKTADSVGQIRRNIGLGYRRVLRLTAEQRSDMDRRILAGETTRSIAIAVGCHQGTVARRAKALRPSIPKDRPSCACGKPHGHGGRCMLAPEKVAFLRRRLREGGFVEQIAREMGMTAPNLRNTYARSIIAELSAEGVACRCGRRLGHDGMCEAKAALQRGPRVQPVEAKKAKRPSVDPMLYRQAHDRYRDGASIRHISRSTGIPFTTAQRLVNYWRATSRYGLKPCACGRPARHPGGCVKNTPGALGKRWIARIEERIAHGWISRDIADELGLAITTVLKHSLPARERLFAAGTTCACGRPVGHNYWCSAKWDAWGMPRGRAVLPAATIAAVTDALVRGDDVTDIAAAVGVSADSVGDVRRDLSPEDMARRRQAISNRLARRKGSGASLMATIKAAVPQGIDGAVRDDIEAELYLAVMEGRLEVEHIRAAVRSFVSRGLAEWQSNYGPKSLDAALGADDSRTLGDMLGDETALALTDEAGL